MLMTVSIPPTWRRTHPERDFARRSRNTGEARPKRYFTASPARAQRAARRDMKDNAEMVKYAEPWFLAFGLRECEPVMSARTCKAGAALRAGEVLASSIRRETASADKKSGESGEPTAPDFCGLRYRLCARLRARVAPVRFVVQSTYLLAK